MTSAEFVLNAAATAGIKLGTDGVELIMAVPLKMPRGSRLSFERAIAEHQQEIMRLILSETRR